MSCAARRQNDQMACAPCGVTWDIDDPEPPPCGLECLAAAEKPKDEDALKYSRRAAQGPLMGDLLDPDFDDTGWRPNAEPYYEVD